MSVRDHFLSLGDLLTHHRFRLFRRAGMHVDLVQFLRLWVYNSEELAHTGTSVCSHYPRHAKRMDQRYTHEQQIAAAEKCPNPMIALRLSRLAVGVSVEEEGQAYEKLDYLLDRMEARLQHGPWVTGKMFSLADVAMAPMVNRIELLARPEMITRQPRVADWWRRIQARPGYQTAFSFKNSDTKDPVKR